MNLVILGLAIVAAISSAAQSQEASKASRLLVLTVSSDLSNDNFARFNTSVQVNELDLTVIKSEQGFDQIGPIRKALSTYKNENDLLVMIVDSSNVILNGNKQEIISKFEKFKPKTRIVFAASESFCSKADLEDFEPKYNSSSPPGGSKYLNSASFIGFAPSLWSLLAVDNSSSSSRDSNEPNSTGNERSQSLSSLTTQAYLNQQSREQLGLELDQMSDLFLSLRGGENNVELEFNDDGVRLRSNIHKTEPIVVQGCGHGKAWTVRDGCSLNCKLNRTLSSLDESEWPLILIGAFIEQTTPFLEEFFQSINRLEYPKSKMHLLIHNGVEYHENQVERFAKDYGSQYAGLSVIKSLPGGESDFGKLRTDTIRKCVDLNCDYYLALDSLARLEAPETLRVLVETNKTIIAPMIARPSKLWSNFWGSVGSDGFYARSHDYVDLVKQDRVGIWNVAHIEMAYLMSGHFIVQNLDKLTYYDKDDSSVAEMTAALTLSHHLRANDLNMYMINTLEFGHLVDPSTYNTSLLHPEFHQLQNNMYDWERRYIHENYTRLIEDDSSKLEQPCQDVVWYPLVNDLFCQHMIEIMESFGKWSSGQNEDPRIDGGYESVPTRDIHMRQIGLHDMWLFFLREFVLPIQQKEYIGYEHDPPRAELAFVVRYHPNEQPSLRPHHDSSTYTLNIALNTPGVDYDGGGCRFIRYNCSVTDSRKGWALMHPGRLTHYHEGLPVTRGTRYIMVTFIDP